MRQEDRVINEALKVLKSLAESAAQIVVQLKVISEKLEAVAEEVCELHKNIETKGG